MCSHPHTNEAIPYLSFCSWTILLNLVISSSKQVVTMTGFPCFVWLNSIPIYVFSICLFPLISDGCLMIPCLSCCDQCCVESVCAEALWKHHLHFLWIYTHSSISGLYSSSLIALFLNFLLFFDNKLISSFPSLGEHCRRGLQRLSGARRSRSLLENVSPGNIRSCSHKVSPIWHHKLPHFLGSHI